MQASVIVLSGLIGLAAGSFVNVVVHRVDMPRPVLGGRPVCPVGAHAVAGRHRIPVVSWLWLRGRCPPCAAAISGREPAIELLTGALFATTALRFGLSWTLPGELAFVAGLVALAACDLAVYLLPRRIVYPTAALTGTGLLAAAGATGQWLRLAGAVACGLMCTGLLYIVHVLKPRWLGFGDVRLAGLLGLALGWVAPIDVLIGLIFANLLGTVVGAALMVAGRARRGTALPYGVFLAAGSLGALYLGASVVSWYGYRS